MSAREPRLLQRLLTRLGFGPRRPTQVREFVGARQSRLEWDWWTQQVSADEELRKDLVALRARARDLAKNNPHAAAFVRAFVANVVGPAGFTLQSRTGNEAWDDGVEAAFADWSRPEHCTVDGTYAFRELCELVARSWAVDGEFLALKRPRGRYGLQLQVLDPDQLDDKCQGTAPNGGEIRMGVEYDREGVRVAYWILTRHPSETGGDRKRLRIPADQVVHLFPRQRPGQSRGIPPLSTAMLLLRMLDGGREAELVAWRMGASKAFLYEQNPESGIDITPVEGGSIPEEMGPGTSQLLPPGVTAKMLDPTHPNANFEAFERAILRAIASGLGISYATLSGDLSSANYSSARVGLLQERDQWKMLQAWLVEHFLRPLYAEWVRAASASGQLGGLRIPGRLEDGWQPRGFAWVDPKNDLEARQIELDEGLTSPQRLCAEQGVDFEDVLKDIAKAQDLANKYGVKLGQARLPKPGPVAAPASQDIAA